MFLLVLLVQQSSQVCTAEPYAASQAVVTFMQQSSDQLKPVDACNIVQQPPSCVSLASMLFCAKMQQKHL